MGSIAKVTSGGTPSRENIKYWNGSIPWVTTSEVKDCTITKCNQSITPLGLKNSSAKIFPKGTVLIAMYGQGQTRGRSAVLGVEAATNQACAALLMNDLTQPYFVFYNINKRYTELRDLANDGSQKNLSGGLISSLNIFIPQLPEQQKIASFLSAVDKKIDLLRQKKTELELYKKGLMQKIFSQVIRFKSDDGSDFPDWEEVALGEVLKEHKEKSSGSETVFSVSVSKGLVDQVEHLGRSFSAVDTSHYNKVKPGDVVYTKSPTGSFPLGIIKQSTVTNDVIVSPLYGVFTPETLHLGKMLDAFFESEINVSNYLTPLVQKGAKNTIACTNKRFLEGKVTLPRSAEEQRKIASFLSAIDSKIQKTSAQIEQMETFKKGLLQQMFV